MLHRADCCASRRNYGRVGPRSQAPGPEKPRKLALTAAEAIFFPFFFCSERTCIGTLPPQSRGDSTEGLGRATIADDSGEAVPEPMPLPA